MSDFARVPQQVQPLWLRVLPCILLLVICAAAYINANHEELLFDSPQADFLAERAADFNRTLGAFWRQPAAPGQQLTWLSFALNDRLNRALGLDGLDITGFLAVSVLLHGINACLVYLLLRAFFRQLEPDRPAPLWFPAGLALLFAAHPAHGAGIACILHRRTALAATFYLLAVIAWLGLRRPNLGGAASAMRFRGRAILLGFAVLVCYWLSYRSSEIALTLPLTILLVEFCLRARSWSGPRFSGWLLAGLILYTGGLLVVLWLNGRFAPAALQPAGSGNQAGWGMWAHFLTSSRAFAHELKLLLLPLPRWMCIEHSLSVSHGLFEHGAVLALALHLGLIASGLVAVRYGCTLAGLGVLWFYAVQIPYMFLPQRDVLVESRIYLPSVGLVLAAGQLYPLFRTTQRKTTGLVILGVLALALLATTIYRNRVYQSRVSLWQDVVSKYPANLRARVGLGHALLKKHDVAAAVQEFRKVVKAAPGSPTAHYDLANALSQQGRISESVRQYETTLKLDPANADAHFHLGNALVVARQIPRAEQHYRQAIHIRPGFAAAHANLAKLLTLQRKLDEASQQYHKALELAPDSADAHKNFADFLYNTGEPEQAIAHYREAIKYNPDYPEAYNNLAGVLMVQGKDREALELYHRAIAIEPDYTLARENLADLLARLGRVDQAVDEYKRILRDYPQHERVSRKLAAATQTATAPQ